MSQELTYKKIFDSIDADFEKIRIKIDMLYPKVIKEFSKEIVFPSIRWYEYVIPASKNRHILFFWTTRRDNKPIGDFFCIFQDGQQQFFLRCIRGGYQHTNNRPLENVPQVHAYTTHFFERYRDRFLKRANMNIIDVACHYFSRNRTEIPMIVDEQINRHINEYGPHSKIGFRVNDGFCFTMSDIDVKIDSCGNRELDEIESMVFVYTTFVDKELLSQEQKEAIDNEHRRVLSHVMELLRNNRLS